MLTRDPDLLKKVAGREGHSADTGGFVVIVVVVPVAADAAAAVSCWQQQLPQAEPLRRDGVKRGQWMVSPSQGRKREMHPEWREKVEKRSW